MKFLIDNSISTFISNELKEMGYNAIHVRDIGLRDAKDEDIFKKALKEGRTIISADTDFGYLLSKWNENKPSVILFRKGSERDPVKQIALLKMNLSNLQQLIEAGSIIIIEEVRIRARELPIK